MRAEPPGSRRRSSTPTTSAARAYDATRSSPRRSGRTLGSSQEAAGGCRRRSARPRQVAADDGMATGAEPGDGHSGRAVAHRRRRHLARRPAARAPPRARRRAGPRSGRRRSTCRSVTDRRAALSPELETTGVVVVDAASTRPVGVGPRGDARHGPGPDRRPRRHPTSPATVTSATRCHRPGRRGSAEVSSAGANPPAVTSANHRSPATSASASGTCGDVELAPLRRRRAAGAGPTGCGRSRSTLSRKAQPVSSTVVASTTRTPVTSARTSTSRSASTRSASGRSAHSGPSRRPRRCGRRPG